MMEVEYNDLLYDISGKLDDLDRLKFMCRGKFAEDRWDQIQDVLTLFQEMERKKSLGIDKLEVLKKILTQVKKKQLFNKVERFETRRKASAAGIFPSIKRTAEKLLGAVKVICNFRTVAGGILVVSTGMVLRSCSSLQEFTDAFNKIVLPVATKLIEISEGSLCFTVQAENLSALRALWERYQNGALKRSLEEVLVNDEIKNYSDGQDVEVIVFIDEQEYKEGCVDLMSLETDVSSSKERLSEKPRRHSDSVISLKTMEPKKMSLALKQAENKLQFERERRKTVEKEIANLPAKLEETETFKMKPAKQDTEESIGLRRRWLDSSSKERLSEKTRRHSDSVIYLKAMPPSPLVIPSKAMKSSPLEIPPKVMEPKKISVKRKQPESKLQFERERRQILPTKIADVPEKLKETETFKMKPAKQDTEESSGKPGRLASFMRWAREKILGDSSSEESSSEESRLEFTYGPNIGELASTFSRELSRRLKNDLEAYRNVCEAFGLDDSGYRRRKFEEIITQFPHTPVKVLKDVFETLQLYDLVELLDNAEVHPKSLRLKGTMQEVKTLRKPDKRQTTYHSNVAVLILRHTEESVDSVKEIETLVKNLNEENDVTIADVDHREDLRFLEDELRELTRRVLRYGDIELSELRELRKLRELRETELRDLRKLRELRKRRELNETELRELMELRETKLRDTELRELRQLRETELRELMELRELRKLRETELRTVEQRVLSVLRTLWGTRKTELRKLDELSALVDVEKLKDQIELRKRELSNLREKIKVEEREEERELIERQSELMETMGKLAELRMRLMKLLESSAIARLEMERLEEELRVGKSELLEKKQEEQGRQIQLWNMEVKDTLSEMIRMVTLEHQKILMTTPLKTVQRWIQTKEMFTFFVVFDLLCDDVGQKRLFEELKGLPNKAKLVVTNIYLPAIPETLLVSGYPIDDDLTAVYKIFMRRWETLDLLSMMEELRRIVSVTIEIKDGLSSSIRFKKLQVKDSA